MNPTRAAGNGRAGIPALSRASDPGAIRAMKGKPMNQRDLNKAKAILRPCVDRFSTCGGIHGGRYLTAHWIDGGQYLLCSLDQVERWAEDRGRA